MAKTPLDQLGLINGQALSQTELLAITDALPQRGPTADRPTSTRRFTGKLYFDTTINALIRWNGTDWIHAGLPVYASTAARDTAMPTPTTGAEAYVASNDAAEGPLFRASGSVWRPPWNIGWGHVASAVVDIAQATSSSTTADWTGLSASFTGISTRRYKVTVGVIVTNTGGVGTLLLTDLSNNVYSTTQIGTGTSMQVVMVAYFTSGISGAVGFKLRGSTTGGTFTLNPANNQTNRSSIIVEDLGPSGTPA